MKKFLIALLFAPVMAFASTGGAPIDKWPGSVSDKAALQNGAKIVCQLLLELPRRILHALPKPGGFGAE